MAKFKVESSLGCRDMANSSEENLKMTSGEKALNGQKGTFFLSRNRDIKSLKGENMIKFEIYSKKCRVRNLF